MQCNAMQLSIGPPSTAVVRWLSRGTVKCSTVGRSDVDSEPWRCKLVFLQAGALSRDRQQKPSDPHLLLARLD